MTVLRSGSATDVGRVRKINQDLPLEAGNLFAVADGMGGHVGGEVAAQVAVAALLQVFTHEPTKAGLEDAFSQANRAVWQEGQDHSELRGMGTTLTAVALVGGEDGRDILALANVGDSRAYLYSEDRIMQVTADHSLAEERVRHGEMTEEEAAVHPQRHILTRALGVASEVETDMWQLQLRSGDRLVLCSDGLSNELSNDEMADILATVPDPTDAAHKLVDTANEHGGSDNITVVVIDVLVGDDTLSPVSVITPVGVRAGAPLVVTHGASPAPVVGMAVSDALAAGAQLGITGSTTAIEADGPRSSGLALDDTQAIPVSRATTRTAVAPKPSVSTAPVHESRRARRRRLGIPRRITLRVVLFILLVAAIPTAAYFAIRWYAYDDWYLSIQANEIVVRQGHPGGVLWFHPRVVDHLATTTSELLPTGVSQIRAGVQEPSLRAAKDYVANLHGEYEAAQAVKNARTATPTTIAPSGATTTAPAPTSTTTTVPTTAPPALTSTSVGTTTTAAATTAAATTTTIEPATTTSTTAP